MVEAELAQVELDATCADDAECVRAPHLGVPGTLAAALAAAALDGPSAAMEVVRAALGAGGAATAPISLALSAVTTRPSLSRRRRAPRAASTARGVVATSAAVNVDALLVANGRAAIVEVLSAYGVRRRPRSRSRSRSDMMIPMFRAR